ncbi:hypothetical protein AJ85_18585 [Alkalihalobacillus alcalophilus ATCC 27647 = CGMCC 1.3604]|uniref:Uncharacterized protein n=1 Tax=Alkalihalobacillus alcalophilus ATCC 27647 = CGMCC 1.3604 TaxID=1218173 RepID=A0A094YX65_ALKAL|nr:hypothetical protein BALCAV_0206245 [Alkalihalobacillus alcalophilus ATCC 27647 = CGMCC 1.3604]THG89305.1 hypothetical protein AJ85_18585 [Alkalihalobacillus alcalophilus ATCC 27647 = CGMCC 1.3604]
MKMCMNPRAIWNYVNLLKCKNAQVKAIKSAKMLKCYLWFSLHMTTVFKKLVLIFITYKKIESYKRCKR